MSGGEVRVAIAGTGFIGAVHARSARLAGARLVGVAASSPERGLLAAAALGAERSFATAEELVEVAGRRRRAHLHAQPSAPAARRGRAGRRQARHLREAAGGRRPRRRGDGSTRRSSVRADRPRCRSSTATTRRCARRASASAPGVTGADPPDPRRLPAGLAAASPTDDNWRVDEQLGGASRAFADIGSHWCDLAEFVSGHRITRVSARTYTSVPERVTEDAVILQFETDHGAVGSAVISQISAGRKNQLDARDRRRRRGARLQPGGAGGAVGRPARARDAAQARPGRAVRRRRRAWRRFPPATRRATTTASTPSSRTLTPRR